MEKLKEDLDRAVQSKVPCCAKELWGTSGPAILQGKHVQVSKPELLQTVNAESIQWIFSNWNEDIVEVDFDDLRSEIGLWWGMVGFKRDLAAPSRTRHQPQ